MLFGRLAGGVPRDKEALRARWQTTGIYDARGTLGVSRDVPVGVQEVSIVTGLQTDANESTLAKLGELTGRYCVVGQAWRNCPQSSSVKDAVP